MVQYFDNWWVLCQWTYKKLSTLQNLQKVFGSKIWKKNGTPSTQLDGKPTTTDTRHASGSKASVNFSNKSTASCQRLPLSKALAQALKLTVLLFAIGDTLHGSCMWKYGMLGQPVGGCLAGKDLRQVWVQAVSTDQRAPDRIAPKFHENLEIACHKSPITMYIVFLSYLHTLYGCVCSLKSYHKISLHIHVKAKYKQN